MAWPHLGCAPPVLSLRLYPSRRVTVALTGVIGFVGLVSGDTAHWPSLLPHLRLLPSAMGREPSPKSTGGTRAARRDHHGSGAATRGRSLWTHGGGVDATVTVVAAASSAAVPQRMTRVA